MVLVSASCAAKSIPEAVEGPSVTVGESELNLPVLAPAMTSTTATPTTTEPAPAAPSPRRNSGIVEPSTIQSDALASIRACESRSNYAADTGNGYYGAYQFSLTTWQSVGGSGNPALASPSEQDMRAQMMINAGRRGEWPNC